jgi:hypothetical protein
MHRLEAIAGVQRRLRLRDEAVQDASSGKFQLDQLSG